MAQKVFESDDLLRKIYGYGDPVHRERMAWIGYELHHCTLSKVPKQYPYSGPDRAEMCGRTMKDKLTEFFQLRRCMCCSRHAHNKPKLYLDIHPQASGLWIVIDKRATQVPECKNLGDCDCNCRHDMRKLAKHISYRSALNTMQYG